jgi:transcriptional regulator with XRE-family HTH domain
MMKPTTTYTAITGAVLMRLRQSTGRQQVELAAAVGLNQSGWSKIERGVVGLTIETLALATPLLGVEPSDVMVMVDRVTRHVDGRGVQVFRSRHGMPAEALQGQLSTRALAGLVEAALAGGAG